jgi:hypothetical protein
MKKTNFNLVILLLSIWSVTSCGPAPSGTSNDSSTGSSKPETLLVDTIEKEQWLDCENKIIQEKVVRRAAINSIKINPEKNIPIDSSAFLNMNTLQEFVPRLIFKGPGGDNYKFATFCQEPKVEGCDIATVSGANRIEYKYWSYTYKPCPQDPSMNCKFDVLEESKVKDLNFIHYKTNSDKVCKRRPVSCPMTNSTIWSNCSYD